MSLINILVDTVEMCPLCLIPAIIIGLILLIAYKTRGLLRKLWRGECFVGDENVVDGPVVSYYKTFTPEQYGENAIVVGLHYTDWCGYCKRMKPVWNAVKKNLSEGPYGGVVMIENDEDKKQTPGVTGYPTIYKMRNGKMIKYPGRAEYQELRTWILATNSVDNYGTPY